jgi:putative flippase GtrA
MTPQAVPLKQRLKRLFPAGQVFRYIGVGIVNTVVGYGLFVLTLFLLNRVTPTRFLDLTVIAASLISTPINITISYFNYKLFVFRTRGNHLREWLRAFGVYGVSMLPGLLVLAALTRLLQNVLHGYAPFGKGTPGYIAGAVVTGCSTIISFLGHKKVTFRSSPTATDHTLE